MIIRETKAMTQTERMESRNSNFLYQKNALNEHISQNKATPHIIDSGKSGIWSYRKWSNGIAECWGNVTESLSGMTAYNNQYVKNGNNISYPANLFVSFPTVNANCYGPRYCHLTVHETNTSYVSFYYIALSNDVENTWVFIHAIGRWTEESSSEDYDDIPTVDQTFDPESANAQSGTAVAEAIGEEKNRSDNTFSNALKGSGSGEAFLLNDVSPVSHEMAVKVRGKNLFDYSVLEGAGKITVNDELTGEFTFNSTGGMPQIPISAKENTAYYVSGYVKGAAAVQTFQFTVYYTDGTFQAFSVTTVLDTYVEFSGLTNSAKTVSYVIFGGSGGLKSGTSCKNIQIEEGTSATAYTPYISDLTDVKVTKLGKNLFDKDNPNKINGYFSADGDSISPAPSTRSIYLACKPNTAYTASKITSARFALGFTSEVPAGGVEVNGVAFSNSGATALTSTSPADAKYLVVWFYHQTYDTNITEDGIMNSIQVELGSAATEYEAYIPAVEYTPESDGTVDGVTSLYPNTTLMTNTTGAIIDCGYNRDINKAYESLLQRVAALEAAALNNV